MSGYSTVINYDDQVNANMTLTALGIVEGVWHLDLEVTYAGNDRREPKEVEGIEKFVLTLVDHDGEDTLEIDVLDCVPTWKKRLEWLDCFVVPGASALEVGTVLSEWLYAEAGEQGFDRDEEGVDR